MMTELAETTQAMRKFTGKWATQPRARLAAVTQFRRLLVRDARELALTATQDIERPRTEVLATDILPTADACLFLERHAGKILAPKRLRQSWRPFWLMGTREVIHRQPWGIVGIIGTWNYPIFLNVVPILQALVAGNTVIWKPSELTPTVAQKLTELFREAGFSADVLTVLPATREAGHQLVEADIDHLVFTGSESAGKQIACRLAERLIPCTLELSGCDAMIVHADADLAMAAKAAWYGSTLNRGQTCLAVRRILVDHTVEAAFIAQLRQHAPDLRPMPLALWPQALQANRLVQDALANGATLFNPKMPTPENDPPRFPPTVVLNATPEMAICQEASFAPIAAILAFTDVEDAYQMWQQCDFQLTAAVFTQRKDLVQHWQERLPVSAICVNDVIMPTAHPATSFAGRRRAGFGSTRGIDGLLSMTTPQTVFTRKGTFRPHYDAITQETDDILTGMLDWKHAPRRRDRFAGLKRMIQAMWKSRKK